ncbi:sodium-dependent proline transporter-like isoform 2-T2 [Morphnus guianensis]
MPGTGHLDMPGPPAPATLPEPTVNILQMEGPTTDPTSQPWPGPPPQPEIPAPSSCRETWTGKYKFLLSCLGYCVGLGSIWRFSYLCYRNGGGVFLIPYFIMLLVMGLPLFLMELSLGQYGAAGPITVWKCCPLLKGIGIAMLIVSSLVSFYYNVIIAWAFYYLGSSFQSPLPWSCDAPRNAYLCQNASGIVSWVSASEVFWKDRAEPPRAVVGDARGFVRGKGWVRTLRRRGGCLASPVLLTHVPASQRAGAGGDAQLRPRGPRRRAVAPRPVPASSLDPCLLLHAEGHPQFRQGEGQCVGAVAGAAVPAERGRAEQCPAQMVYFTATFPYLAILTLIIWGATLDGSLDGVRFYLSSDWSRLQSAQVWSDAASQICYSLGIGFGGLVSMASYNEFHSNVIRNALVLAIGSCCTSCFAGFAIFSVLGHMAWRKQVPVGSVTDSGPGLMFVAYPEALSLLPISPLWSVLFFLTLLTLGVDTLFGNIQAITTAILDEFPALHSRRKKVALLGALCTSFYLLGLLLVTQGGIFWLTLMDKYSTGFGLITVSLFMCLGIAFCYGVNQFCQDIMDMICQCPPWCRHMLGYFKACWTFFTPCLLLAVLICTCLDMHRVPLHHGTYEYPTWGMSLSICMGVLTCLQVPLWAVVALCRESGTLSNRFQKAIQPLHSWRAAAGRNIAGDVIAWRSPSP